MPPLDLTVAAWLLFFLVVAIVTIHTGSLVMYARLFFGFTRSKVATDALPPAAVVLSIRGPDPYLEGTLQALLQQDYPDFVVSIVVDDEHDPAHKIVDKVIRKSGATNVRVSVLRNRRETCSLKCSSLIQAVEDLEPKYQAVAFIDGDAKPHAHWLRDLVVPLSNPRVGVVTGNRWYMPKVGNWGSLVRYFWNSAAVVQVWFNGIVWAGSMALRRECIDRVELLAAWSRALSVDGTVYCQLKKHRLKVQFAPSVMMVNPEHINLPVFRGWVRRQLVAARYASEGWTIVTLHGIYLAVLQLLGVSLLALSAVQGNGRAALTTAAAMAIYWGAMFASAAVLEAAVRKIVRLNAQSRRWLSLVTLLKLFPAMALTHFVYFQDLIAACFCRRVSWRGVEYTIKGKNNVQMVSYRPYHEIAASKSLTSVV